MKKCSTCGKTVAFGGVSDSGFKFCNKSCYNGRSFLLDKIKSIPDADAVKYAGELRGRACQLCNGSGPVDVHKSISVMSFILFTRSEEHQITGCVSCGNKDQLKNMLITLFAGWWGIPFGIIFTPVGIILNTVNLFSSRTRKSPSKSFILYAKEKLALGHDQNRAEPVSSKNVDWDSVFGEKRENV